MSKDTLTTVAVVGAAAVGGFLLLRRHGSLVRTNTGIAPGTVAYNNAQQAYSRNARAADAGALIGGLVNIGRQLLGGSSSGSIAGNTAPLPSDPTSLIASANADGIAFNPVNGPGVTYADEVPPDLNGWGGGGVGEVW